MNADSGWNNYLYDAKTKKANPDRYDFEYNEIEPGSDVVALDYESPDREGWRNFVGQGDPADFAAIILWDAASLSFDLSATDATKFTISRLDKSKDKNGKTVYSVKTLQTTALKKDKNGEFAATTKNLTLDSGTYYISMQSTNAAKGGAAFYNVTVNQGKSVFYETPFETYDANFTATQLAGGTDVVLKWAASKSAQAYFVRVDGGKEQKVTKTTYTFKKLSMTEHKFTVYAKDKYGNKSEVYEDYVEIADTVAPKLSGLSVKVANTSATVKFKGQDNVRVAAYEVSVDNGEYERYFDVEEHGDPSAAGVTFSNLGFGNHTVTVRAWDSSENVSNVLTKTFTVKPPKGMVALKTSDAYDIDDGGMDYSFSAGETRIFRFETDESTRVTEIDFDINGTAPIDVKVYRSIDEEKGTAIQVKATTTNEVDKDECGTWTWQTAVVDTDPCTTYYVVATAKKACDEVWISSWDYSIDTGNNSFARASESDLGYGGEGVEGLLCAEDKVDYYRFTIDEAGTYKLKGKCYFGKANVTIYGEAQNKLFSQTLSTSKKSTEKYFAAGEYYAKFELSGSRSSGYYADLFSASEV